MDFEYNTKTKRVRDCDDFTSLKYQKICKNKDPKKNKKNNPPKVIRLLPPPSQQPPPPPPPPEINNDDDFINFLNTLFNTVDNKSTAQVPKDDVCKNPTCNHKTLEEDPTPATISTISKINDIEDLISLGKTYHCKKNKDYYGLNLRILCNLVTPLTELRNMIGLRNVKTHIVNQILFFLRGYNKNNKCNQCVDCSYNLPCSRNLDDMLHTVITGPPGVGKTQLGKILCKVYKETGILSKGHFNLVTRSDFIAKYLGQTAIKTQQLIDKCIGGVMFIDEAYSLGHSEGRDSFSKECLDTLNQNLSEKRDLLCIIAGYKNALDTCFFSMNDGLARRFTFRYDIEGYTSEELMDIFLLKLMQASWEIEFTPKDTDDEKTTNTKKMCKKKVLDIFRNNKNNFPNYGGDIETLFLNCKIVHCRKIPLIGHTESSTESPRYDPSKTITVTDDTVMQVNNITTTTTTTNKQVTQNTTSTSMHNDRILSYEDILDGFKMYQSFRKYEEKRPKSPPPFMYI